MGLIYLDACLLIYLVERHPVWGDRLAEMLGGPADLQFGISPLVKFECLVGPIKRGNSILKELFAIEFERFVPLAMPEPVYLLAAELRAQFGVTTPDALHLACAQYHRCDGLWTNDDRLARVSRGFARNVLVS
ncbi:MAG TPA: PIN domain-containing protein [Stellaceae bacterium]|nr:PIN domain-containing protein [Stellaceae bacterium]